MQMIEAEAVPSEQSPLLGEILRRLGKLGEEELERALRTQHDTDQPLGKVIVSLGMLSEQEIAEVLAQQLEIELVAREAYPDSAVEAVDISLNYMRIAEIVPLKLADNSLYVAMSNPQDDFTQRALHLATGYPIVPLLGLSSDIKAVLEALYEESSESEDDDFSFHSQSDDEDDVEHLKDLASEGPVVRIVNQIMTGAMNMRASDIHIEPFESELKVRYRIDGVIHETDPPPPQLTAAIISRIKLMARLNIAERRLPQDGRIQLRSQGKELDMRVSTVPTMHGESVVMRLLDKQSVNLSLTALGFSEMNFSNINHELAQPHGIILVTGPTGSGKTTTLYAALSQLNTPERKILTVEDPVEYELAGINQIQVNAKIGLDFAGALRSIVRQDPDVIMIGEMRDAETVRIAVQAALTGHLVLSTIHTNDAAGAVTRLLDMGVEDYLITSTVNGILAQRLVRRLCPQCKQPHSIEPELIEELQLRRYQPEGELQLWKPQGCSACSQTGYKGRAAIHELLLMDDPLRRLILKHEDAGVLQVQARKAGMLTMYEDGLLKVLEGVTTLEEVLRVTEETRA